MTITTKTPGIGASARPSSSAENGQKRDALPLGALLALAMAGFITILTEALPAGLLPQMASSLAVSEAMVGQLVTIYAIGSLVAAIPLTAATQGCRRRPLLLTAIGGFVIANSVTALSTSYALTMAARFCAGVSAGLLWALIAGHAARMVPDVLKGRAIAIAMLGTPLALSLGIPAGTLIGSVAGWQITFGIISVAALLLIGWVAAKVPDFPGQAADRQMSPARALMLPGILPVLLVLFAFVLSHNILYTYIAPFLAGAGMADRVEMILLVFGVAALAGIWIVAMMIDRWLRRLVLAGILAFLFASAMLGLMPELPVAVLGAAALWGLAFGGAATLFQTASANAAGDAADVAQSMIVTVWNLAIAGGGIIGGLLLDHMGAGTLPWALVALLLPALAIAAAARTHGFPGAR